MKEKKLKMIAEIPMKTNFGLMSKKASWGKESWVFPGDCRIMIFSFS